MDKTALQAAIDKALTYDETKYTEKSWAVFAAALAKAEEVNGGRHRHAGRCDEGAQGAGKRTEKAGACPNKALQTLRFLGGKPAGLHRQAPPHSGNRSGTGTGTSTPPMSSSFVSDTTADLHITDSSYQFRITSKDGTVPVMTVTSSAFRVELVSQEGNDTSSG